MPFNVGLLPAAAAAAFATLSAGIFCERPKTREPPKAECLQTLRKFLFTLSSQNAFEKGQELWNLLISTDTKHVPFLARELIACTMKMDTWTICSLLKGVEACAVQSEGKAGRFDLLLKELAKAVEREVFIKAKIGARQDQMKNLGEFASILLAPWQGERIIKDTLRFSVLHNNFLPVLCFWGSFFWWVIERDEVDAFSPRGRQSMLSILSVLLLIEKTPGVTDRVALTVRSFIHHKALNLKSELSLQADPPTSKSKFEFPDYAFDSSENIFKRKGDATAAPAARPPSSSTSVLPSSSSERAQPRVPVPVSESNRIIVVDQCSSHWQPTGPFETPLHSSTRPEGMTCIPKNDLTAEEKGELERQREKQRDEFWEDMARENLNNEIKEKEKREAEESNNPLEGPGAKLPALAPFFTNSLTATTPAQVHQPPISKIPKDLQELYNFAKHTAARMKAEWKNKKDEMDTLEQQLLQLGKISLSDPTVQSLLEQQDECIRASELDQKLEDDLRRWMDAVRINGRVPETKWPEAVKRLKRQLEESKEGPVSERTQTQ
uniref:Uncharacterized protein n=1 Tax=Chromera velia CCMP2878 TaxID=1169474 RepID=A0A0G4HRW9_9ALVE|eukprot:Cvel_30772.t1-p1 / transcript=Cvel_30772.t1 / gene=Cvel_30772 / organism=Chromera_velia_CCMP2878 / gene_product=hypothetical protein / transcript_product=hypothetical protein / location=Cvel_scaffold4448:7574-9223(+) / protein_length=550 / sequence_SO=supercontig / SO=protein_coding / is_pseudo=false